MSDGGVKVVGCQRTIIRTGVHSCGIIKEPVGRRTVAFCVGADAQ
jgi:hypothetical protein